MAEPKTRQQFIASFELILSDNSDQDNSATGLITVIIHLRRFIYDDDKVLVEKLWWKNFQKPFKAKI